MSKKNKIIIGGKKSELITQLFKTDFNNHRSTEALSLNTQTNKIIVGTVQGYLPCELKF